MRDVQGKRNKFQIRNYSLSIISFYFVTYFIYRDFAISNLIGYILLSLFVILMIIESMVTAQPIIGPTKLPYIFLCLLVLFFFLMPNSLIDNYNLNYIVLMLLTLLFLIFGKFNERDIKIFKKLILTHAIFLSLFVLFFQANEELYWRKVFVWLSPIARDYATRHFFRGYGVSVGGISYTLYVIVLGFIISLAKVKISESRFQRFLHLLFMVLFFITVLLSGRRGELLTLILTLSIYYLINTKNRKRLRRMFYLPLFILILTNLILKLMPILLEIESLRRITSTINKIFFQRATFEEFSSGRNQLYHIALKTFSENPLFGIGFGKFKSLPNIFTGSPEIGMDTHNIILQTLAEQGLIGAFLIFSIPIKIYYTTLKDFSVINENSNLNKTVVFASTVTFLLQTFIFILSMIDPINYKSIFWVLYFISFYLFSYSYKLSRNAHTGILK